MKIKETFFTKEIEFTLEELLALEGRIEPELSERIRNFIIEFLENIF